MGSLEKPSRRGRAGRSGEDAYATKNVVCGMEIGSYRSYAFIYQGREYRFCSLSCVEKFKVEPEKFCARASED